MITEHDLSTLLDLATTDVHPAPLPLETLIAGGRRARRRRTRYAAAAGVAAVVATGTLAATTPWSRSGPAPLTGVGGCQTTLPSRVLPAWARAGFSVRDPRMPYVVGREGRLAALVFAQPLTAPAPTDGRNNKILWVVHPLPGPVRRGAAGPDLVIHASLVGGTASVVRTVPDGPGPSIVDLPTPGCWHLDLSWSGLTDSMNLYYAPR